MLVALLASLALHVLFLALWLVTVKRAPKPADHPLQIRLITLPEITKPPAPTRVDSPTPSQKLAERPAAKTKPPSHLVAKSLDRAHPSHPRPPAPAAVASSKSQATSRTVVPTQTPTPSSSPAATQSASPASDAPRVVTLTIAPPLQSTTPGGTLIVNTGEDPVAKEAARVEAQRDAEAEVKSWAGMELGRARVRTGGIDSYFAGMRQALEATAKNAPPFKVANVASEFLHSYLANAARYGATGGVDSGESQDPDLRNFERRLSGPPLEPGSRNEQIARGLGGTRVLLREANEIGVGMVALIEIHQDRSGGLVGARLVRTSGSKSFDAYALASIPKALAKLPAPGEKARGTNSDGIHTLWAFRGEVTYLRPAKDFTAKDLAYLASAGALSALAGNFDLATGEVNVIDFRHPRYVCKVRLLSVY